MIEQSLNFFHFIRRYQSYWQLKYATDTALTFVHKLFATCYQQLTITPQNHWNAPSSFFLWPLVCLYSVAIIFTDIWAFFFYTLNPFTWSCTLFKGRSYICEKSLIQWLWLGRHLKCLSLNRESLTNSIGKWGCFRLVLQRKEEFYHQLYWRNVGFIKSIIDFLTSELSVL